MSKILKLDSDYIRWLTEIKSKIRSSQQKVALTVNSSVILFYWELGKMISKKQSTTKWGDKLIEQLSKDLKEDFPSVNGLSVTNLKYCKRFYLFYQSLIGQQAVDQFTQQPFAQIPWGHNIHIFTKILSAEAELTKFNPYRVCSVFCKFFYNTLCPTGKR